MTDDRTFDWRPPPPERLEGNRPFLMSVRADSVRTDRPLRSWSWKRKAWLDQGAIGSCTGFGAAHALSSGTYAKPATYDLALAYYRGAQRYDQWAGEAYEGSSVLGVMEYLHKETGLLRAYWWPTTLVEVCHAVAFYDPVEMGSWWTSRMMNTDSEGYVHPTGGDVGGHAYCVAQVNVEPGKPIQDGWGRIDNSWDRTSWGVDGSARIRLGDLGDLLARDGECALPRKNRVS